MKYAMAVLVSVFLACPLAFGQAAPGKPAPKPDVPERSRPRPPVPIPPGRIDAQERQKAKEAADKRTRILRQIEDVKASCQAEQDRAPALSEPARERLEQILKASQALVEHLSAMAVALETNDISWDDDLWFKKRDLENALEQKRTEYWYQMEVDDLQRTKERLDNDDVKAAADELLKIGVERLDTRRKMMEITTKMSDLDRRTRAARERFQQTTRNAQLVSQLTDTLTELMLTPIAGHAP